MSQDSARPTARTTGLVVKTVADEVLVYDLATHRMHALDPLAAMLWQACDGQRSVPALAAQLHVPVIAVEHGLGRLRAGGAPDRASRLLADAPGGPAGRGGGAPGDPLDRGADPGGCPVDDAASGHLCGLGDAVHE